MNSFIIIIILYFENVTFFHALKLGSDVCPRVDNQTSGNTSQDLTRPLVEKSPSASYPPMGIGASFWWRDALPHQLGLGKRHWNLETSSAVVEFPPPYRKWRVYIWNIFDLIQIYAIISKIYRDAADFSFVVSRQTDNDPPHGFSQTFFVKPLNNSYFIYHDIFRLSIHNM